LAATHFVQALYLGLYATVLPAIQSAETAKRNKMNNVMMEISFQTMDVPPPASLNLAGFVIRDFKRNQSVSQIAEMV